MIKVVGIDVGATYTKGEGTYSVTAAETTAPAATILPGYTYVTNYHDASNPTAIDIPASGVSGTPNFGKPSGYAGLGSENDYIQTAASYHAFNDHSSITQSPAVATIPPLT